MAGPARSALNLMKALAGFGGRGYRGGLLTTGLVGGGLIAAGKGVSAISDTPWGQEQSPINRAMLGLGSVGIQATGYLAIARGAIGSAQAGFDRFATARSAKLVAQANAVAAARFRAGTPVNGFSTFSSPNDFAARNAWESKVRRIDAKFRGVKKALGGPLSFGSPVSNFLFGGGILRAGYAATAAVAKAPFRMATGTVDLFARGMPRAAKFFFGRGGGASVGSMMRPQSIFANVPGAGLFLKNGEAALGSGMFTMAGAGALAAAYVNDRGNKASGWKGDPHSFNPEDYGQGFYAMRQGPASNYGPALTLALHRNNSRVMP